MLGSKGGVAIFFIPPTCRSQDTDLNAHVQGVQRPRQMMHKASSCSPEGNSYVSLSHGCCCIRAMERVKWETGEGFRERLWGVGGGWGTRPGLGRQVRCGQGRPQEAPGPTVGQVPQPQQPGWVIPEQEQEEEVV